MMLINMGRSTPRPRVVLELEGEVGADAFAVPMPECLSPAS